MINYRNKTIFDWKMFKRNDISSIESLDFMESLKSKLECDEIQNILIRNFHKQIGIIIQSHDDFDFDYVYAITLDICEEQELDLRYFAFQKSLYGIFYKNNYFKIYKNNFIETNFNDRKYLMFPDSFFQPNIHILNQYFDFYKRCIDFTKCDSMINIGDDGGNIGVMLSSFFKRIICYFHCLSSMKCLSEMLIENKINNITLCNKIDDLLEESSFIKDTLLFINPGRKGLQSKEMIYVGIKRFKYIIYMACENKAFEKDFKNLDNYTILFDEKIESMPNTKKIQTNYLLKAKL